MTRTFLLLPEEPMRPRIADSRIGTFFAEWSISRMRSSQSLVHANRWNLEPSDEAAYKRGETGRAQEAYRVYVDSAFPEAWKPAIKQGIEDWNMAFEKIGFKNAVQAVDFPTDDPEFDPDNLKYSCVRYAPTWTANAMGPSWKDPRSGEIVCASVYFHHNIAKLLNNWRFVQTAQIDTSVRRVTLPVGVMQEGIRYVTAHEVGHCLGLMHNMAASSAFPVDSLRSVTFTRKYGTTPSIMDYARYNYIAQPGDQGVKLTPPQLGVYDLYAIKWLYTPLFVSPEEERVILDRWISEKAGDPLYRYGKQQVYARYDPSSIEEDLGDYPIKASTYGIKNLKYIMGNMNDWLKDEDLDFQHRAALYDQILTQYKRYFNNVLMNVGGMYLYDIKTGDAPGVAYKSVPKEIQRASVSFLLDQLYDMDWLVNEELLKNLPPQKRKAREMQIGTASMFKSLMTIKKKNGVILSAELSDDPYTLDDYLDDIFQTVWKKTIEGKSLQAVDKTYQNDFVVSMISAFDPNAKAGSLLFTDPEAVRSESLGMWDKAYAPTLDEVILYGLDQSGFATRMEGAIRMAANLANFETEGFGWQREVKSDEVYNTKALQFSYLQKVKALLERRQNSGSAETQEHYKHMLYKVNRILDAQ
ncbi:MAG: zinc-dependent metalloprotease [Alistipes sp.]